MRSPCEDKLLKVGRHVDIELPDTQVDPIVGEGTIYDHMPRVVRARRSRHAHEAGLIVVVRGTGSEKMTS